MPLSLILLIVGVVLSLPVGLFAASLVATARARALALLGGVIGAVVVALAIYYFVIAANVTIDALSYFYGVFFAASVGVFIGALLVNFLVRLVTRDRSTVEY